MFIPTEWVQRLSSYTDEGASVHLQAFVRQLTRHEVINVLKVGSSKKHALANDWNSEFYALLSKTWCKKEVAKLFKSLATVNKARSKRVDFLSTRISNARAPLEQSCANFQNVPYTRNISDLKINLGTRTKLLNWFAYLRKVPSKRTVNVTLPVIRGKHIAKLLTASEDIIGLKTLLNKYERRNPAIIRNLRLHGGNTGKWSADALQYIF